MRTQRCLGLAMLCAAAAACGDDAGTLTTPGGPSLSVTPPACVEFGPPPPAGTIWGAPAGHVPGSSVHLENGIKVLVQTFQWGGGGSAFNFAQLGPPTYAFANGQAAGINNINLQFLFGNLGWIPSKVYFSYLDEGGFENLSVNGSLYYIGDLHLAPPSVGGRNVSVSTWVPGPGAIAGWVKIDGGSIKTITVGGQEFWIDKVCAEP
ncbi:MAG TPA: hypothetical protein VF006_02225 [Longimicrobium sp.]